MLFLLLHLLYNERFTYYCSFYFMPFRPSNSDFGYFEEGEATADYTTCVGSFAYPGIDTQVQGITVTTHSKDEAIEVK
jgi:hypothetical protein